MDGTQEWELLFSDILLAYKVAYLVNPSFQALRDGLALSKMKSFLCFQICRTPIIKVSMKKLDLNWLFASSIIAWKVIHHIHNMA
jgi:hypothetical protein